MLRLRDVRHLATQTVSSLLNSTLQMVDVRVSLFCVAKHTHTSRAAEAAVPTAPTHLIAVSF